MLRSLIVRFVPLALLALALAGCALPMPVTNRLSGSGRPASRHYPIDGFTALHVSSAFHVTVVRGDTYKVTVTTDDNLLPYVQVSKDGDTLDIRMQPGPVVSFTSHVQEASITMPELQQVHLDSASQASVSGFRQIDLFQADLDGASQMSGDVQAKDIRLSANGASRYVLSGSGMNLDLDANSASQADLNKLVVDKAEVRLNAAAQANINAKTQIGYNLNGASRLHYAGSPAVASAQTRSASTVSNQ